MYAVQKCAALPKNRCEKCIGPVMHEQMPAYTVYIGKTGAFYMKKWKTRGISLLLALVLITERQLHFQDRVLQKMWKSNHRQPA